MELQPSGRHEEARDRLRPAPQSRWWQAGRILAAVALLIAAVLGGLVLQGETRPEQIETSPVTPEVGEAQPDQPTDGPTRTALPRPDPRTSEVISSRRPTPERRPTSKPEFKDAFGGPEGTYIHSSTNDSNDRWYGESGSDPVRRSDGLAVKTGDKYFHRFWSRTKFGGPGTRVRITSRVRTTSIRDRRDNIIEGTKFWIKFPHPKSTKTGPESVIGYTDSPTGPGSYQVFVHAHRGYTEVSRNQFGPGYTFFPNKTVPYALGTWEDVEVTFEWLADKSIRVTLYREGKKVYSITDKDSPFWPYAGYVGVRTDGSTWEMDHFTVESF